MVPNNVVIFRESFVDILDKRVLVTIIKTISLVYVSMHCNYLGMILLRFRIRTTTTVGLEDLCSVFITQEALIKHVLSSFNVWWWLSNIHILNIWNFLTLRILINLGWPLWLLILIAPPNLILQSLDGLIKHTLQLMCNLLPQSYSLI